MLKKDEMLNPASCLNRANPDEMLFVLLARDAAAPATIRFWINERVRLRKNQHDDTQITEAIECAIRMEMYRGAIKAAFIGLEIPAEPLTRGDLQQPEAVPTLSTRWRDVWDMAEPLMAYRDHHRPTGDFLRAVLENDLLTACAHADHINRTRLYRVVQFVYSQLPSPCYGSPEKVNAWLHPTQTK